jgi:Predicted amidohydrolase
LEDGPIQSTIRSIAKRSKIWIVAGSIPLKTDSPSSSTSTTLVYDTDGKIQARYDKIHLFDATLGSTETYHESSHTSPGNKIISCDTPVGKIGLSICYDLRFPELFRCLYDQGVEVYVAPSAFTRTTGRAHWHTLCKARAIENSCYLVAANQGGQHDCGRDTYGHSMIIDPWGRVIREAQDNNTIITAQIDPEITRMVRTHTPFTSHRRIQRINHHSEFKTQ